ncbi:hypothetical protein AMELA_G00069890 [Ameiurus melas]|uniref:Cystatin domain-containing protein n=1 Tax=Ameiurus melas TaxID=219545 RepID=A0A7J6B5Q6_AMEME|nr:hypothetical protein AMELA_G00069890 [Ameiurus melas]
MQGGARIIGGRALYLWWICVSVSGGKENRDTLSSTHCSVDLDNMDGALKVCLLMSLLVFVQTLENYRNLPDEVRQHIDTAVKEASKFFGARHHIAYHSLKEPVRTLRNNFYVNVLLKVTKCKKKASDAYEHRDDCNDQKQNTPWIDCLVCKKEDDGVLVDCDTWRAVKDNKRETVRRQCKGLLGSHSAFLKTKDDQQIGCLGCI